MYMTIKQFKAAPLYRYLIMYVITALLFLMSFTLHIHTQEAATFEDHGVAVSISAITADIPQDEASDEIVINPDSAPNAVHSNITILAIFLLVAVLLTALCRTFIGRIRQSRCILPVLPFLGAPLLRAPPAINFN
jgi:uncharacterized membrane protein